MEMEELYEVAAKELYVNAPRKGLYAQAFSEALGDPTKAQAIYMRLRVEQIQAQIEQREAEERQKAQEAKQQQERAEWRRHLAANPRPSDYVAALEEEGFAVEELTDGCWAIKRTRMPTVHVYGIDRLRETTCLLLGKEWATALERVQARLIGPDAVAPDDSAGRQPEQTECASRVTACAPAPVGSAARSGGNRPALAAAAAISAVGSPASGETTDLRFEKGKRWFANAMWCTLVLLAVKIFFLLGTPHWGTKLGEALIGVIGAGLFFGLVGFVLGWLTGGEER